MNIKIKIFFNQVLYSIMILNCKFKGVKFTKAKI